MGGDPGRARETLRIRQRRAVGLGEIVRTAVKLYPRRTVVGLALFIGQAFLYNAGLLHVRAGAAEVRQGPRRPGRLVPRADRARQLLGRVAGPALFGRLVDTGEESAVSNGYLLGAVLMIAAGIVEIFVGVEAAGRSLEDVAAPLSAQRSPETVDA
jgi:hypothetical protein